MGKNRKIDWGTQFKRDLKKQYTLLISAEWAEVLNLLVSNGALPAKYCNHMLKGEKYKGYFECHIKPDLLLIYKVTDEKLFLARLGSHSELF